MAFVRINKERQHADICLFVFLFAYLLAYLSTIQTAYQPTYIPTYTSVSLPTSLLMFVHPSRNGGIISDLHLLCLAITNKEMFTYRIYIV